MNNGNAEDWHNGCIEDEPRNVFIIPKILAHCSVYKPQNLMFLGCATGYIPYKVSTSYSFSSAKLVDIDKGRLSFAESLDYGSANIDFCDKSLEEMSQDDRFDLIVISNTLLEFETNLDFTKILANFTQKDGAVIVFLPDVLEDVVNDYVNGSRLALVEFMEGVRKVEKKDKFTLVETNFYAHRLINLASTFLKAGFRLIQVEISSTKPKYYLLRFEL